MIKIMKWSWNIINYAAIKKTKVTWSFWDSLLISSLTSSCLFGQVQAVKLNIGVTVTANLAIFLFLVQVAINSNLDLDQKTNQMFSPLYRIGRYSRRSFLIQSPLQECLGLWLSQLEARADPESVAEVLDLVIGGSQLAGSTKGIFLATL